MSKTEERKKYNKEYSARPEVIAWAKTRNARPERKAVRKKYKKSERGKEADKRSRRKNWAKHAPLREKQLLWRYGLTPEQFEEMRTVQEGRCAICRLEALPRLHIDHNHKTGKVRGLLCGNCNKGIGLLRDDTVLLQSAMEYLQRYV